MPNNTTIALNSSLNAAIVQPNYRFQINTTEQGVNELLIMVSTGFVLLMQLGFAFIENGMVRKKNSLHQNFMNVMSTAIEVCVWWLWGYGLAFGYNKDNDTGFAGGNPNAYATSGYDFIETNQYPNWIFQFAFCGTATTIISGGICERATLLSFLIVAMCNTGLVYPIVAYWTWGGGWLQQRGYQDFAGCGVVHIVGGVSALVAAWVLGPRYGFEADPKDRPQVFSDPSYIEMEKEFPGKENQFRDWIKRKAEKPFKISSAMDVAAGTLVLWVGWFYFNGGSAASMYNPRNNSVCKIIMNTIIGAGAGGVTNAYLRPVIFKTYSKYAKHDLFAACDGVFAGLVGITACCNNVEVWTAFVVGVISALISIGAIALVKRCGIDDPINAAAIHTSCGIWGLIAVGIFDNSKGLISGNKPEMGRFFGYQICGAVVIIAWTLACNIPLFFTMKYSKILRVPLIYEIIGLDYCECGKSFPAWLVSSDVKVSVKECIEIQVENKKINVAPTVQANSVDIAV